MRKKHLPAISGILFLSSTVLCGAAGRPSDGWLSFVVILGFLGAVLGMLYLIDLIRALIRRLLERNGEEAGF
jgi:divalent metal cation (Fe/Co/Zn/Cd) transporter